MVIYLEIMETDGICDKECYTQKRCLPSRLLHLTSANLSSLPLRLLRATLTVVVGTCRNLLLRRCNRIFIACYCEKRYTDSERRGNQ